MQIILKGYERCNLYVGGDRRDKSVQNYIESSPDTMFLIKKGTGILEIWTATDTSSVEEVPVVEEPEALVAKPDKKKGKKVT